MGEEAEEDAAVCAFLSTGDVEEEEFATLGGDVNADREGGNGLGIRIRLRIATVGRNGFVRNLKIGFMDFSQEIRIISTVHRDLNLRTLSSAFSGLSK